MKPSDVADDRDHGALPERRQADGARPAAADPAQPPWHQDWPASGLESVPACPVCAHTVRHLLHGQLVDRAFQAAPGRWQLWQCARCGSAWLDPRPDRLTIALAYRQYYTHQAPVPAPAPGLAGRLRQALAQGYLCQRFGLLDQPAWTVGAWLARCLLPVRLSLDHQFRHLPSPTGPRPRVLDVGCGAGEFLARARRCGWQAQGVEPDPQAVARCRSQGLDVIQGDIAALGDTASRFDLITLSHVIEHVHDPRWVLQQCHRLLRPGGTLWLETPNLLARGHALFGPHWRGLETPRHLVLFNPASLQQALASTGFGEVTWLATPDSLAWTYEQSLRMAQGRPPGDGPAWSWRLRLHRASQPWRGIVSGRQPEFLTLQARKPG